MGHTNSTVNYNLPQFVGTDKPSWLGDVNGAFLAIDSAIAAAKTEADSASGGVASLQNTVDSHTTQIRTLTDSVTAQGGTLNSVTALIGNGTPTTTDQTIIGAINELNADKTGSVSASYTVAFNADSAKAVNISTLFPGLDPDKIVGIVAYETTSNKEFNYTYRKINEDVIMRTHNDAQVTGDFTFKITALLTA